MIFRYLINGIFATIVHYGVFTFNLNVLNFTSAGLANMSAAVVGIGTSFLGSRYYVFCETDKPVTIQAMKFGLLYGALAVLHFLVLLVWTDWLGFDYRLGFLMATGFQVSLSYIGNKFMVFKT